jgi:hypothetical protein
MALTKINNNTLSAVTGLPAAIATGKVLQVVQSTTTTPTSTTSTSYADTTLSGAITPSATSSKILVIVNQDIRTASSSDRTGGSLQLLRGSTVVYSGDAAYEVFFETGGSNLMQIYLRQNLNYLDSPSSTSELTYKTQARIYQSGTTITTQESNIEATITLMEIAG